MPRQQQNGITTAVGIAEDADINLRTLIGTSEPRGYIRGPMRGLIQPGDIVVKGTGRAEADVVSYALAQGWNLIGVGATRDICPACAAEIAAAGADAATPKQ
jgi:filamentous hemagglutinin